jgi:hypothetical protein
MRHYTAAVRCPKCGFEFRVCVHTIPRPERRKEYVVPCPANASLVRIPDTALVEVDTCPAGAVVVLPTRDPRRPI